MKKYSLSLAVFLIFLITITSPSFAASKKLTILFTGDTRGEIENCHCPKDDFGGLERRANYIDEARKETNELLLVDIGDTLPLLSPDFDKRRISYNAFISLKSMGMMGYDAVNAGESDFILGELFLKEKAKNLDFPVISANIIDKHTKELLFKPYIIKTMKNGLKVGIIGLTNERYVVNSKKLDIAPNKDTALRYLPELKANADLVIALGHLGIPYSIELADSIKGIDVILSGHWETETQEPINIGSTIIMPNAYYSRRIGRLDLEIDGGKVSSYQWHSMPMDERYESGGGIIEKLVSKMPKAVKETKQGQDSLELIEGLASSRPLRVLVFYAAGCRSCMVIERDILPEIEKRYEDKIIIERYDIGVARNYEQMTRLERLYGVEAGGYVPEVIVSRYVLIGEKNIKVRLDKIIEKALSEPAQKPLNLDAAKYQEPAGSLILSRFESFSPYTLSIAGFLDGINPCAFTTIVFFISFLAFAGYRKKEMFFAGLFFVLAVFTAYFMIGLGIFRFLRALEGFNYLAIVIDILIGALAFLLGIISLVDYLRFKKTKDVKTAILQLPLSIKNRIHSVIGADFRQDHGSQKKALLKVIWIALTSGFMVSVLESICTGQVYLPTIAYVLRMPGKNIPALFHLLFYNIAFIAPLIAVFLLGLFGATSNNFSRFMQRHFGLVKLSTAILFFALGSILIIFK
jgi:hypothetical protein